MTDEQKADAVERALAGEEQCDYCGAWQLPGDLIVRPFTSKSSCCINWNACMVRRVANMRADVRVG